MDVLLENWEWILNNAQIVIPLISLFFASGFYASQHLNKSKISALEQQLELERSKHKYSNQISMNNNSSNITISDFDVSQIINDTHINLERLQPSNETAVIIKGTEFLVSAIVVYDVPPPLTSLDIELKCCLHPTEGNSWHVITSKRVEAPSGRTKLTGVITDIFTESMEGGEIVVAGEIGYFDQESGGMHILKSTKEYLYKVI